jgi:hypothetical protein
MYFFSIIGYSAYLEKKRRLADEALGEIALIVRTSFL